MSMKKWPKQLPLLSAEQQRISNDFMLHWHESLASNKFFSLVEKFNHGYSIKNSSRDFVTTLEIGAGIGEHLNHETLTDEQKKNYVALELRESMAAVISKKFPQVQTLVEDCQQPLPFTDGYFDRILAIHVLEHLTDLPATVKEMHRLCNKKNGLVSVVIPCEGGIAYSLARKLSAQRQFERRYKQSYRWFIEREHINRPSEIFQELAPYFSIEQRRFFPLVIPLIDCNLCIGITLRPKELHNG